MTGIELARRLRKPSTTVSMWMAKGIFKTSRKILLDHRNIWEIDDKEGEEYIRTYEDGRSKYYKNI